MKIGILGAMPEEIASIKALISQPVETFVGSRIFTEGYIGNQEVVIAFSRWGKVAASSTTTILIHRFGVDSIIFTGVAGAVCPELNIGDIVIAKGLYQHDMDARPIFKQYQIPLTNTTVFEPDATLLRDICSASEAFVAVIHQHIDASVLNKCSVFNPSIYSGLIASGDTFITNAATHTDLNYSHMDNKTLAVEMEGAAVAQVCEEHELPYAIIRTISDRADHTAAIDFQDFINNIASKYSAGIMQHFFRIIQRKVNNTPATCLIEQVT